MLVDTMKEKTNNIIRYVEGPSSVAMFVLTRIVLQDKASLEL